MVIMQRRQAVGCALLPKRVHVIVHGKDISFHLFDGLRGSDEFVVVIVDKLLHLPIKILHSSHKILIQ